MSSGTFLDMLFVLGSLAVAFAAWYYFKCKKTQQQGSENERPLGEWIPQDFEYPPFEPLLDFDIHTTSPIRYRPFRWGPKYNVTMGIRPMSWESWIELDNTYLETYKIKKRRAFERGSKAVCTLPGAEKAALEVCTELTSYLAKRYPQVFRVTRVHDNGGLGEGDSIVGKGGGRIKTVEVIPVGDIWDLDKDDPMLVAGLLSEDLGIMIEGSDGQYYLRAGSICVPGEGIPNSSWFVKLIYSYAGFWRLEDKIGLPLKQIHLKGGVYQYREKLELSLDRFFRKLPLEKPVLRNNIDPDLAWATIHHGDEDKFDQSTHTPRPEYLQDGHWQPPNPTTETYFHPITEMMEEPGVPGRLAAAIRSWPEPIGEAKAKDLFAETLLPLLDEQHQKQIISGIIKEDDRADYYPY
ncbi:hypothetical protein Clacol_002399 [Clathrus columnatus]|uniref:Uncharacterized protein n=1 Tax=Clathrus columnatus TaxID=1419009 RepID=A0AAV5A0K6_9AGAM|nr:hypothetical protein Clacol_002399 [Clathrus columnatus]